MGQPAAKQGDRIVAIDIHVILVPTPGGPVPTPRPHPFSGALDGGLSGDVNILGRPAATVGSTATNAPPHLPMGPGPFQKPPANRGKVVIGSATVFIGGRPALRANDLAGCGAPILTGLPTVLIG